ncbi:MAG: glycosyltransferase family 4 protein [bacterium]|nr:glycosyltransferase family 4 protein [bacterium]
MHTLMISLDPHLFDPASDARRRHLALAALTGSLTILVRVKNASLPITQDDGLTLIPVFAPMPALILPCMIAVARRATRDASMPFDLIVTQDIAVTGLIGLWLKGRLHTPVLVQSHSTLFDNPAWIAEQPIQRRILVRLAGWVAAHADAVRTVNQHERDALIRRGIPAARIHVLPLATASRAFVDPPGEQLAAARRALNLDDSDPVVLWIGYPVGFKRVDLLIDVFRRVVAQVPAARLVLIGLKPGDIERLRGLAERAGIAQHVRLHPAIPHDRLPAYYALANVYALTSSYEGLPRVLFESGAAGIPSVGFAVPGVREMIADGVNGYTAAEGDIDGFAAHVIALLRDRAAAQRMGERARTIAFAHYDAESYPARWAAIWHAVRRHAAARRITHQSATVSNAAGDLLLFNLATDADDPVLGFTTEWINRLAAHFRRIDVITMRAGRVSVAPNVRVFSMGKERGDSEPRRALAFYRILARLLLARRYTACFAHMTPLFAAMGAPVLARRGVPITLWYTHRQDTRQLRAGAAVSRHIVTAAPDSFPFPTPKLRAIGHGIDTAFFAPSDSAATADSPARPTVIHTARLMPIKHQATLIRAIAAIPGLHATLIGEVPPGIDSTYKTELQALVSQLQIAERVRFAGALPRDGVRAALDGAFAAVNLSPPGLFDKAALESMAMGIPTLVSSPAFRPLMGAYADLLTIPAPDDHAALTDRLKALLRLSADERAHIGAQLRAAVTDQHSLDRLIARIAAVLIDQENGDSVTSRDRS